MIKRTVFPAKGEPNVDGEHWLDPVIRKQLAAKPRTGDFFGDYNPSPKSIDIFAARKGATVGIDISSGITAHNINVPCADHYIPGIMYQGKYRNRNLILYLHGGGFMVGSAEHKDAQCRYLTQVSGSTVLSVDYRLAPENPFPAAIQDTVESLRYCSGLPHTKLVIGGDSAGACLAANAIMQGGIPVDYAFFIYGAFDLESYDHMYDPWSYSFYECMEEERDLIYNRLNRFRKLAVDVKKLYLQNKIAADNEIVSPAYAKTFYGFPKSLFVIAEYDYYRFCNESMAKRMDYAGVDTEVLYYEGLDHGFFDRLGTVPQTKECIEEIGKRIAAL